MLYTAKPLERIYADPSVFDRKRENKPTNKEDTQQFHEVILPNGRIITRRDGENDVIEKINSTDMKDYLKEEYYPGKNIRK